MAFRASYGNFSFVGLKIRSPEDEIMAFFRVSSPFLGIIGPNSPFLGKIRPNITMIAPRVILNIGLIAPYKALKCGAHPCNISINETNQKQPSGTFSFVILHKILRSFGIILKPFKSL